MPSKLHIRRARRRLLETTPRRLFGGRTVLGVVAVFFHFRSAILPVLFILFAVMHRRPVFVMRQTRETTKDFYEVFPVKKEAC